MSKKELYGDVCAFVKGATADDKNRYPKIGTAFKDERGQISLKIDCFPIPSSRWDGWVNILPPRGPKPATKTGVGEDNEPF